VVVLPSIRRRLRTTVLGLLPCLAALLAVRLARADVASFAWEAPAECPSAASVERDIVRYLGRPISSLEASVWIRVAPLAGAASAAESRGFRLELRIRTRHGERVRELTHDGDCAVLARAAAVIAAIALDPSVMDRLESADAKLGESLPKEPEATAARPSRKNTAAGTASAGERPARPGALELGVGVYGLAAVGGLPGLGVGAGGGIAGLLKRLRVEAACPLRGQTTCCGQLARGCAPAGKRPETSS
jgi:hypothetical protein